MKKTVTAILTALAALSAVTAVPANALTRELQVPDEIGMYWDITEDPISGDAYYSDLKWLGTGSVLAVTTPAGLPEEELLKMWDINTITEWTDVSRIIQLIIQLDTDRIYQEYGSDVRIFVIETENKGDGVCRRLQRHYPTVLGTAKLECKRSGRCEWTGDYELGLAKGLTEPYQTLVSEIREELEPSRLEFSQWQRNYNIWSSEPANRGLTGAALRESLGEYDLKTPGAMLVDAVSNARNIYQEHEAELLIIRPKINMLTYETNYRTASEWKSEKLGDMDGSGTVDASDASEILMLSAKAGVGDAELTEEQTQYADVNNDRLVNAKDASCILQYAAAKGTGTQASLRDYQAARETWNPEDYC